jgi:DNA-binding MarR family transcriptional regulator
MSKGKNVRPLSEPEYLALAEFRYQLRRFLRHMEEASRHLGANPQQYQLILAIKGLPAEIAPTISHLAERMQLNHNSMVELVDRCEEHSLLRRIPEGESLLRRLGVAARQELRDTGPILVEAILRLTTNGLAAREGKAENRVRTAGNKKSAP